KVGFEPPVKDGILWPEEFSSDGKSLLLRATNKGGFMQMGLLELLPSAQAAKHSKSANAVSLFGPDAWDVTEARYHNNAIFFLVNEGGASGLYRTNGPGTAAHWIDSPTGVARDLSVDHKGTRLVMLRESITRPTDVWILDLSPPLPTGGVIGGRSWISYDDSQITFSLMGGVKSDELSRGQIIEYESFDKLKIHSLFVKPRVARLGTPPPAIVYVHGGPNSQKRLAFDPFIHVLAEAGFAVIAPNYRGSTGYGKKFEDANNKDWGGADLKDLVAAVEFFGKRSDIDVERVGITGGSYGGYMSPTALCKTPCRW